MFALTENHNKKKEAMPALSLLLPICTETQSDVFLNILKNSVGRSKLDDNNLDRAFKSGMTGQEFTVDLADVSDNWENMTSASQQIIQSKLLGLWAAKNFPSIGKKLFGKSYQTPQRNAVKVNENSKIDADEIDDFIFKKMKLRVIQLYVCQTTVKKLIHFVEVPEYVGNTKEILPISCKMKSFDIDTNFVKDCWNALKSGEFPINSSSEQQVDAVPTVHPCVTSTPSETVHPCVTSTPSEAVHPCVTSTQSEMERINTKNGYQLVPPMERTSVNRTNNTVVDPIIHRPGIDLRMPSPPKRPRIDTMNVDEMNDDSSIGSLREVILQMRQDIAHLTKSIDNGAESVHVMIIKQKDAEIEQKDAELAEYKNYASSKDEELITADNRSSTMVNDLQRHIQTLDKNLAAKETSNEQTMKRNEELQKEVFDLKSYAAGKDEELIALNKLHVQSQTDLAQSKIQVHDLVEKLAEAEKIKEGQWYQWKTYVDGKDAELAELKHCIARKDDANKANEKLQVDLSALKNRTSNVIAELNQHIQSLVKNLSATETVNEQSIKRNEQLEQELRDLKSYAAKKDDELALFLGNQSRSNVATQTSGRNEVQSGECEKVLLKMTTRNCLRKRNLNLSTQSSRMSSHP